MPSHHCCRHRHSSFHHNLLNGLRQRVFAILCIILLAACSSNEDPVAEAQHHYDQALAYMESGQFRAAAIEARNVTQKAPNESMGLLLSAKLLNKLGQYKFALETLKAIPENKKNDWEYIETHTRALIGRGKFASALAQLTTDHARKNQQNVSFLELRAQAHTGLNQLGAAEADFIELNKLSMNQNIENSSYWQIQALSGLARLALSQGNEDRAQQLINDIETLESGATYASILRAQIALANQDLDDAEIQLTNTLSGLPHTDTITPERATVLKLLADVLVRKGHSTEALIYTQMLADAFPGYDSAREKMEYATNLYQRGEKSEAEQTLQQLLEEYPNFEQPALLLAIIRFENKDYAGAAKLLKPTVDAEVSDQTITALTALSFYQLNQPKEIFNLLEPVVGTTKNSQLLAMHGSAALALNKTRLGLRSLNNALDIEPNNAPALIMLAQYYSQTDKTAHHETALSYIEQAYAHSPNISQISREFVRIALKFGKSDRARAIVEERLKNQPNNLDVLVLAGDFYNATQEWEKAEQYYNQALESDPKAGSIKLKIADLHQLQGKPYDSLIEDYLRAAKLDPSNIKSYQRLISLGIQHKTLPDIEEHILRFSKHTNEPTGIAVLGIYHAQQGNIKNANQYLADVVSRGDEDAISQYARYNIGYANALTRAKNGDYANAKQEIFSALAADPDSPRLLALLTELEVLQKNHREAERIALQVKQQNEAMGNQLLGFIAFSQEQWLVASDKLTLAWQDTPNDITGEKLYVALQKHAPQRAREFLQEWRSTMPNSAVAINLELGTLLHSNTLDEALPLMFKLKEIAPNNAQNLNNLAWVLNELGDQRAAQIASKAYALAPDNADILDTYGWISYRNGDRAKALQLLEKATQLAPNNPEIAKHLDAARNNRQ